MTLYTQGVLETMQFILLVLSVGFVLTTMYNSIIEIVADKMFQYRIKKIDDDLHTTKKEDK